MTADSGQCVSESHAGILRTDNGSEISLPELTRIGNIPLLWSVDGRRRLIRRKGEGHVDTKSRDVYRLKLASGRQLDLASDQQVLKLDSWSPVSALVKGSRLGVLRRVGTPASPQPMDDSEVILLAHMIGDGSCVRRQPIRYASVDEANLAAVTLAAAHFGVTPIRDEYAAARVTTLRLPAPYRLTHGKRNPIAEWLDRLGLFGLRSYEKYIPDPVFALPTEQVSLFLRHLWATDGSVRWDAKAAQGRVYYASTSRQLVDGVMNLLLRVGVQARITRTSKAGYRDCWFLSIDRAVNQVKFLTQVGVHGARGVAAKQVVAELAGRPRRPGTDTIPAEVWDHVKRLMAERNWPDKDFALATNPRFDGPRMWTHCPGRTRLHRLSNVLASPQLHDLATDDIYWDRVVSAASVGRGNAPSLALRGNHPVVVGGALVRGPDNRRRGRGDPLDRDGGRRSRGVRRSPQTLKTLDVVSHGECD